MCYLQKRKGRIEDQNQRERRKVAVKDFTFTFVSIRGVGDFFKRNINEKFKFKLIQK